MYAPAHASRLWFEQEGSGPPLVLLHGLGDSHGLWRHQIEALAGRYRVIGMDLRGHGRSPLDPGQFSLEQMADDVRATMDELGLDRAFVAGLSMGGGVAQTLAIAAPRRVRALILVSTSSEFPDATRKRFVDRAARAEAEGMNAVVDATVPRWFTDAFAASHPEEVQQTRRTVLATDPHAFAAASRANAVRNLTAALPSIGCPVLFIGGAKDPADPRRALAIYRSEIQHLQWSIIPDASHLVPVEAPETFNRLVLRFLEGVEQTAKRRGEAT